MRCFICGLTGFIGVSKNAQFTNQLICNLFEKSEIRGEDAAGFWATENGNGKIFYHKEPVSSSSFINNNIWLNSLEHNLDCMIAHARGASKGVGEPRYNKNNHPFVSSDKLTSLIHNGRIDDEEYNILKKKFELFSDCDSEILLRIYESNKENDKINSIKNIFNLIKNGHMAVVIGERLKEERVLWLFRNQYRPLWIVDTRENLGQIFFVSEPSIWFDSIEQCDFKNIIKIQEIIELPPEEIWKISISDKYQTPNEIKKFKNIKDLQSFELKFNQIKKSETICEIVTGLNDKDEVVLKDNYVENLENIKLLELDKYCNILFENIDSIKYSLEERVSEQSILKEDLDKVINVIKMQNEILERLLANL